MKRPGLIVESMKVKVVCGDNNIKLILNIHPEAYSKTLERAFSKIESNLIVSSWRDSYVSGIKSINITDFINVPEYGCFKDVRERHIDSYDSAIAKVWSYRR